MRWPSDRSTYQEGAEVVGADGETVGKVVSVHDTYVIVGERVGSINGMAYVLPTSIFGRVDDDSIYLSVTKDQALAQAPIRVRSYVNGPEPGE